MAVQTPLIYLSEPKQKHHENMAAAYLPVKSAHHGFHVEHHTHQESQVPSPMRDIVTVSGTANATLTQTNFNPRMFPKKQFYYLIASGTVEPLI